MDLNSSTPYEELAGVYNTYVDDMINEALSDNRNALSKEKLMKIPYSECYLNSITAAIGKQNKGKTLTILKQIIIIANTSPYSHVLIYINRSGSPSDDTFESLKHLIKIPIIYLSQEEAEDYLKTFLMYKELYNTIKKQGLEDKIIDKQRDELFETLSISNFDRESLHSLIFLDDAVKSKLITNEKSYFNQLLTQCRHIQCSFFMAVQYFKALSTNIKSNLSTLFIFSGFSRQQLNVMLYQVNLPMSINELYTQYQQLGEHGKIIVDLNKGSVKFD
ncbi:hypothetical protein TVAG_039220 [Trichomonas vaginalis G3]|uniref:Uncharacterized protein n=1 Tax=Trichomonas vaginalis (strain ATCC PRA-98 / G3) TaxID=412133 RepID=A2E5N3_TRIV3|nr:hypothetical protein TVAG_039220 [Trichomonas vaginalis G3]|eukprot:XP_001324297.1 hypothetical protein [Trichomonas vaginalis G3]